MKEHSKTEIIRQFKLSENEIVTVTSKTLYFKILTRASSTSDLQTEGQSNRLGLI